MLPPFFSFSRNPLCQRAQCAVLSPYSSYSQRVWGLHTRGLNTSALRNAASGSPPSNDSSRKQPKEFVDEKIPYKIVQCVNPETDELDPPTTLKSLIESVRQRGESEGASRHKRQGYFLRLVSHDPPVVKITSKVEAYQFRKTRAEQHRKALKGNIVKEIQLTWGVAEGDWKHKANKARSELVKGNRVDIVFATKAKTKAPHREEMGAVEVKMAEELSDAGWRWKETKFSKTMMVLHLRSLDALPKGKAAVPELEPTPKSEKPKS